MNIVHLKRCSLGTHHGIISKAHIICWVVCDRTMRASCWITTGLKVAIDALSAMASVAVIGSIVLAPFSKNSHVIESEPLYGNLQKEAMQLERRYWTPEMRAAERNFLESEHGLY